MPLDEHPAADRSPRTNTISVIDVATRHLQKVDEAVRAAPSERAAISAESRRDWGRWGITGHRLRTLMIVGLLLVGIYSIQDLIWSETDVQDSTFDQIFAWGAVLWASALIPGSLGLIGLMWYCHSDRLDDVMPIGNLVVFRIVSRGTNESALLDTIRRCQAEMSKSPLFPYVIEVVTDGDAFIAPDKADIVALRVPDEYETSNGSRFKARALQYAVEFSVVPDTAWLVHLDEETHPTSSGIKGIAQMITDEEATGALRIGQGAILYHRKWREHPFLTLADNVRTGDDLARFHFQHRLGVTIFGLHGSFIVCRNDVEKEVGFDFGPVGSITEDAFWALVCMENGSRCRWVDGYLEEQSTQSVLDFMKQRRRWYLGLVKVTLHAPTEIKYRVCLGISTLLWSLAPIALVYTFLNLALGGGTPSAAFAALYFVGLAVNLDEHGIHRRTRRWFWTLVQLLLLPVFSLIESASVLYALLRPSTGFHVVKK
jgi:beta-1,4-mannosyltransferase